jgi:hypothetical protein
MGQVQAVTDLPVGQSGGRQFGDLAIHRRQRYRVGKLTDRRPSGSAPRPAAASTAHSSRLAPIRQGVLWACGWYPARRSDAPGPGRQTRSGAVTPRRAAGRGPGRRATGGPPG